MRLFFFFFCVLRLTPFIHSAQVSCPPGFFDPECSQQCTYCGVVNGVYDCEDGPTGSGECRTCPSVPLGVKVYGKRCSQCRTGLIYDTVISSNFKKTDWCEAQFAGQATCSTDLNQITPCKCADNTLVYKDLYEPVRPDPDDFPPHSVGLLECSSNENCFQTKVVDTKLAQIYSERGCCKPNCDDKPGWGGCMCDVPCRQGCTKCHTVPAFKDCYALTRRFKPELLSSGNYKRGDVICEPYQLHELVTVCDACLDFQYYDHTQDGCRTCPSTCSSCSMSGDDPNCFTERACQDGEGVCFNPCPPGIVGPKCDKQCSPSCPSGSTCRLNGDNEPVCGCDNPDLIFSDLTYTCIRPSCGVDRDNMCNNHGICVQSQVSPPTFDEFCACNNGWDGLTCEIPKIYGDECDCGTLWSNPIQKNKAALLNLIPLYDMPGVRLLNPPEGKVGVPVGNVAQAQDLCSKDFFCDEFLIWAAPSYGIISNQVSVFNTPVLITSFYSYTPTPQPAPPAGLPTGVTFVSYSIDRIKQNNCSSPAFDLSHYYTFNTANQKIIKQYCKDTQNDYILPSMGRALGYDCDGLFIGGTDYVGTGTNRLTYWPIRHWRYVGHQQRLSPNALCNLNPVVFDPKEFCHQPRCLALSGQGPPCVSSGGLRTGYCMDKPASPGDYQCKCLEFFQAGNIGPTSLNYQPAFQGLACQFPITAFCIEPEEPTVCNGVSGACQSRKTWNGDFYLQNFEQFKSSPVYNDYVPECNCANTPYKGTYCQESRCPGDCKSLSASAGNCELDSNSIVPETYKCVCGEEAIGQYCEVSADACLIDGYKCSGRGTCKEANVNHTTAWCDCQSEGGFYGTFCENYSCDEEFMVPGHGYCENNTPGLCFPAYTGTACAVDKCAVYHGVVTGTPPSGCICDAGYSPYLNGALVPQCWPQCPKHPTLGTVCGNTGAGICNQVEQGTVTVPSRTAVCACNHGFIFNSTTKLCDPYCAHGTVDGLWTANNPTPCICSATTGFDTNNGQSPKCDHPICNNRGVYNQTNATCICEEPYESQSNCLFNKCTRNTHPTAEVIEWLGGLSKYKCSCPHPSVPLDPISAPYNCDGNICGVNGMVNSFYDPGIHTPIDVCVCKGHYRTVCNTTTQSTCDYCTSSHCLNGGSPYVDNNLACECLFPFTGELCELNECQANHTATATVGSCLCLGGFSGSRCEGSTCLNNFPMVDGVCACDRSLYTGLRCETPIPVEKLLLNAGDEPTLRQVGLATLMSQEFASTLAGVGGIALLSGLGGIIYTVYQTYTTASSALANIVETKPLIRRRKN